jgi:hypothetical protein
MVVYAHNGNIYAKVYSNTGVWQYTHTVADHTKDCGYPSVAYEASTGLFLVAYEHYLSSSDHDIYVAAISPTAGKLGSTRVVAFSVDHEWYPDVACKHTNGTCLVAYQHNAEYRIKGKFFTLSSTGISAESGIYNLTAATNAGFPHLAWGVGTGYYMVTYTWMDSGGESFPMYNKVYDYPVTAGDQHIHNNAFVVSPTFFSNDNDKYNYDVAFDPCTRKFLVSFYRLWGPNDNDVYAVAKHSSSLASGFTPFSVAASFDNEYAGAISFVTDGYLTPACGSMDKLVVAYDNNTVGIKAADLRGNSSTTNPVYVRDDYNRHLVVEPINASYSLINYPAISSGRYGELMIAYEPYWTSRGDGDIWARIVEVRERTYLPLTLR